MVSGNRLLVIGDSITASTTERYGGEMCTALAIGGWQVEIAAEVGKHIEYAQEVLAERFVPEEGRDLDAVVINLGTNFRGDHAEYQQRLEQIVDGLGDRQVVLITVTEFDDDRVGVNSVIVDALIGRPNVRVVDWAGVTRAEPAALQTDRIHLSNYGRARLVQVLVDELGEIDGTGQCLSGPVRSDTSPPPEELLLPDAPDLSDLPDGSYLPGAPDVSEDSTVPGDSTGPEDPDLPDGSDLERTQDP
jgi:lysophospholipase L1-like esterase